MNTKIVSDKGNILQARIAMTVVQGSIATSRLQLQKRLVTNEVFNLLTDRYKELSEIMPELVKNSFDSFIDRIIESSYERRICVFSLTIEASCENDSLFVRIRDNGKPITLNSNGNPVNRKRQKGIHFGGAHLGIQQAQTLLRTIGGQISWQALSDGTVTEVKIPVNFR